MKRFTRLPLAAFVALAALGTAPSCGRDHEGLALRDDPPGGGTGGSAAGSGGMAGSAGRARGGSGGSGAPTGGVGGKYVEPPGRSVTTVLHGVVDAERVLFCFARADEGEPVFAGDPEPSRGLEYGTAFAFESLDGIELDEEALLPFVIAGELELVDGLDCADAVERAREEMELARGALAGPGGAGGMPGAGGEGGGGEPPEPPRLRVGSLPVIPEGALAEGYSSLVVAVGCLGGPAFTNELERDACGSRYEPEHPTLSAMLVTLSRVARFDKIVLQTMNATSATTPLALLSAPPATAVETAIPIAYDLARGELAPRQPTPLYTAGDYGFDRPNWRAQVTRDGTAVASELWVDVLERAGREAFENGRTYSVIALGPRVRVGNTFWNPPTVSVIDNDPEL